MIPVPLIVMGVFMLILAVLGYMGFFQKITVYEETFEGGYYLYKQFQGHFNNRGQEQQKLE